MLDGTQAKYGDIMNDMNLMDELLKIPADATAATVLDINTGEYAAGNRE